jgi:hypothetical protein
LWQCCGYYVLHRLGRLLFFRGVAARSQVSLPLCSSVLELVPAEASGHLPKPRRSPGAACRGFFFFEPVSWSSRLTNIRSAASDSTRDEIGGSSMSLSRRNILWHLLTRNWPVFSLRECSLAAKSACPPRWWVAGSQGWRQLTAEKGSAPRNPVPPGAGRRWWPPSVSANYGATQ